MTAVAYLPLDTPFKGALSRLQEHALPASLLEDAHDARKGESHGVDTGLSLPQRPNWWSGTGMTASSLTPEPAGTPSGGQPELSEPWGTGPPFQEQVLLFFRVILEETCSFVVSLASQSHY